MERLEFVRQYVGGIELDDFIDIAAETGTAYLWPDASGLKFMDSDDQTVARLVKADAGPLLYTKMEIDYYGVAGTDDTI